MRGSPRLAHENILLIRNAIISSLAGCPRGFLRGAGAVADRDGFGAAPRPRNGDPRRRLGAGARPCHERGQLRPCVRRPGVAADADADRLFAAVGEPAAVGLRPALGPTPLQGTGRPRTQQRRRGGRRAFPTCRAAASRALACSGRPMSTSATTATRCASTASSRLQQPGAGAGDRDARGEVRGSGGRERTAAAWAGAGDARRCARPSRGR